MIANRYPFRWNRRRWLSVLGAVVVVAAAAVAWRQYQHSSSVAAGLALMEAGRFAEAAAALDAASDRHPSHGELAFLAAVALRRAARLDEFETLLHRAEEAGWPADAIRLQRLLAQTQHGLGTPESDAELDKICMQGVDDFTAVQIYEARAKGYMSIYRVDAAMAALNFWIDWQQDAVSPRLLRAQLFEQTQNLLAAEEDLEVAVKAQPDNVEARLKYAQLLAMAQKTGEAIRQFEACIQLSPDEPHAQLGLIQLRLRSGRGLDEVEQSLHRILDRNPDDAARERAQTMLANVYLNRREYSKVVDLLKEAEATEKLTARMYPPLIQAYVALKQRDKAAHYRKLLDEREERLAEADKLDSKIRQSPGDPDLRDQMAQLCLGEGNTEGALTWWYTAIVAEPNHQPSHEALANYYQSVGNELRAAAHRAAARNSVEHTFELAWRDYEQDLLPSVQQRLASMVPYKEYRPHADLLRCALDVKIKRHEFDPQRLEVLQRLADYPHLRLKALTVLGSALVQLGNFSAAEPVLLEVLKADPDMLEAHRSLAALNFDLRALFRARQHFDEWGRLAPTDHRPPRFSGLVNNLLSSYKEAALGYEESLKRNPNQPTRQEVLLELAECQHRTRDYELALKTLAQAVDSVAGDALKAQCLIALRRTDEARQMSDGVLAREATNLTANIVRADIAILEKDDDAALKCLLAVTENHPFEESAWFKLSQVYVRQKKTEEAREVSRKADKIRDLRQKYLTAEENAIEQPDNVQLREELVGLARELGRDDLAQMWQRSIDLLQSQPPGESSAPALDLGPVGPVEREPAAQDEKPAAQVSP